VSSCSAAARDPAGSVSAVGNCDRILFLTSLIAIEICYC
jgi:hypothetical protein